MKILKEEDTIQQDKVIAEVGSEVNPVEDIPATLLTSLVAKGWDDIGVLKAQIEGIVNTFKNADKVTAVISQFIDQYLIFIGQCENILQNKLSDNSVTATTASEIVPEPAMSETPGAENALGVIPVDLSLVENKKLVKPAKKVMEKTVNEDIDDWDFECDFDEPVGEALTEAELYSEDK